jgi:hypothetical protein
MSYCADCAARIAELEAEVAALTTLYPAEQYDPKRPALWWTEIHNRHTGQNELVCTGLLTARTFDGLKWFSYLPQLKGLPCPIETPARSVKVPKKAAPQRPPKAPLSQRRQPGLNLDGSPRKQWTKRST